MPSTAEAKSVTAIPQTEKPTHYTYLKEFRVEQCPLFIQHKCTQHKPFVCFYWHFMNQRRRRPVRKRDGTFNYNPDVYCSKYDETTGVCTDGDDCPYLHRTAGDTERRYHLRYYKTGACVYDTDSRGYCVKNGPHCAFAHGIHDLRNPVYDIKELQAMESTEEGPNGTSGPNNLDKERNALNEDPKWQDTNYVLANYKTEQCKRPPRLCRQGYACPQFHNNRDRRRSPKKFKYRSTPCPNVKQGDEWGDPTNCENGDNCPYCHTRTEQQFHPEIYKSTKCNDILQTGYCPRGPFCAFAHVDKEISAIRDLGPDHTTDLAAILSNALPSPTAGGSQSQQSPNSNKDCNQVQKMEQCSSGEQEQQSSATIKTNNSLPELQPGHDHFSPTSHPLPTPISRPRSYSSSTNHSGESHYPKAPGSEREDKEAHIRRHLQAIDNDISLDPLEKSQKKQNIYLTFGVPLAHLYTSNMSSMKTMSPLAKAFYPAAGTVESVVGNALDDLNLDDINVEESIGRDLINDSSAADSPISAGIVRSGLLGASAPMNIPCSGDLHENRSLSSLSPPINSPLGSLSRSLQLGTSLSQISGSQSEQHPLDKATAAAFYGHSGSFSSAKYSHYPISSMYDFTAPQNMSPGSRIGAAQQPSLVSSISAFNSIGSSSLSDMQRFRDDFTPNRVSLATWENGIEHVRTAYDGWRRDTEELSKREMIATQQRDEALAKVNSLQKEVESLSSGSLFRALTNISELGSLPINKLKQLKDQLSEDIKKIDKVILYQTTHKCFVCEEKEPGVTILPCNHYVLCNQCAPHQKNCPFCAVEITSFTDINASL